MLGGVVPHGIVLDVVKNLCRTLLTSTVTVLKLAKVMLQKKSEKMKILKIFIGWSRGWVVILNCETKG